MNSQPYGLKHKSCNSLDDQGITMLRHKRLSLAGGSILSRPIEVSLRHRSVLKRCRREQCVDIAVLIDEALRDDPEDLGPDFANGVYTPVTRLVESLVC